MLHVHAVIVHNRLAAKREYAMCIVGHKKFSLMTINVGCLVSQNTMKQRSQE